MPAAAKAYVTAVATGGVAFFVLLLWPSVTAVPNVPGVLAFVALTSMAELRPVWLSEHGFVSVAPAFHAACYIVFEPGVAAVIAAISSLIADVTCRRPAVKAIFNAAQYIMCVGAAGLIYRSAALLYPRDAFVVDLVVFVVSSIVYYLLNVGFVCVAFSLAEGIEPFKALYSQARLYLFQYLSLTSMGMLLAVVYSREPFGLVLLVLPIIIVYTSIKSYTDLQTETRQAMEALADSIDRRDDFTFDHSLRVAGYSASTAREMKLPESMIDEIYLAARIHDLGKVGLTNKVLFKKGHLNELEWERIMEHPEIGEQIAGRLKFYHRCTTILRHHHENYDGSGYPDGVAGKDIPIGALIIRVADAFDAMATDRPYRKALPREVAVAEIRNGSGTLFCPEVVDAFLRVISQQETTGATGG